jgi:hypothetical protein
MTMSTHHTWLTERQKYRKYQCPFFRETKERGWGSRGVALVDDVYIAFRVTELLTADVY